MHWKYSTLHRQSLSTPVYVVAATLHNKKETTYSYPRYPLNDKKSNTFPFLSMYFKHFFPNW